VQGGAGREHAGDAGRPAVERELVALLAGDRRLAAAAVRRQLDDVDGVGREPLLERRDQVSAERLRARGVGCGAREAMEGGEGRRGRNR
jgi:hypothetical protein